MDQGAGVSKGSSGLGGKRNPTTNVKILGSFALEYQLGLNTLRLGGKFFLEVLHKGATDSSGARKVEWIQVLCEFKCD